MYRVYNRLNESPIPDYMDKNLINKAISIQNLIKNILNNKIRVDAKTFKVIKSIKNKGISNYINEGMGRVALHTGKNSVIKIALNEDGVSQNEKEVSILSNIPENLEYLTCKLLDSDNESYIFKHLNAPLWVEVERLNVVGDSFIEKKFKRQFGLNLSDDEFLYFCQGDIDPPNKKAEDLYELLIYLREEFRSNLRELENPENWGLRGKNLVIIDFGY